MTNIIAGALRAGDFRVSRTAQVFEANTQALLTTAIGASGSGNGDVILLPRGGIEVTSSIAFNMSGIRVIAADDGMAPYARGEFNGIFAASSFTDGPAATITAPCSIEGVSFASRDTGATFFGGAACLIGGLATALPFGVHLKNCRFPKWGLSNRIGLAIEGSSNCLIEDSDFEGAFGAGIYVQGAIGHLTLRNNHFCLATYAIEHGQFSDAGVNTQLFYGPGNVTVGPTKGVKTNSNPCLGTIFGNFWATPVNSTHDLSIDNVEATAGLICAGNYYADEERDDE